jgi:Ca2+-binding EF-hand superfamily protein
MKRNTLLLAALIAASPTLLIAATPATTGTAPAPGAAREDAWFQKLDTNKDGAISKEEAQAAADQRITRTFDKLDTNHDGLITQAEVTAAHEARRAEMQAQAAERFKQANTNGDGLLSKDEVSKGMPRLARAFDRLDTNKDGELSPEEMQAGRQQMMAHGGGGHWRHGPQGDSGQTPAPALK